MKLRNKKTGEYGRFMMCHDDDKYQFYIEATAGSRFYYHNFGEMLEAGWDVCITPQEPLIKDEKIRKAVRAWAEALDTECCSFRADHDIFDFIAIGANCLRFDMSDGWGTYKLEDIPNGWHTITELCGEEE